VVLHHSAPRLTSIWMAGSPTGDLHPISPRPCWAYTTQWSGFAQVPGALRSFVETAQHERYTSESWCWVNKEFLDILKIHSYPSQILFDMT
jgi:hypothetical protein